MGPPPPPPRGALVRGAPVRGAIARGAAVTRGVPPLPAVRGAPASRARAAGIQRIPLPPPPAPETYEDYVRNIKHCTLDGLRASWKHGTPNRFGLHFESIL